MQSLLDKPKSLLDTGLTRRSLLPSLGEETPQQKVYALQKQIDEEERKAQQHKIPVGKKDKLRVWDFLEWARYPITNMLYTAAKEHKDNDLGFEDVGKILKSAVYGAMLKERRDTQDVLKLMFPGLKPWQYTVFGIAGDVITDPLTWVTFGGAKAGAKGLRAAARAKEVGEGVAAGIAKKGTRIAAREGAESAATKAFEKTVIGKYGGRNLNEAIDLARRSWVKKITKPGINIRVPFTPLQKQVVPGGRTDILADLARKIGMPQKATQAIREAPTRVSQLRPVRTLSKIFQPGGKLGALKGAHDVEVEQMAAKSWRMEGIKRVHDDALDQLHRIAQDPPEKIAKYFDRIRTSGKNSIGEAVNVKAPYWKRDQLLEAVRVYWEKGKEVPEELRPAAGQVRRLLDDQYNELVQRGLLKKEQYIKDYFPRYWTNKDTGEIRAIGIPDKSIEGKFLKHRVFQSAEEARRAGFEPRAATESLQIYLNSVNKMLESYDTIGEWVRRYGTKAKDVAESTLGSKYVKVRHEAFKDWVVPMDIGNAINRIDMTLRNEDELRGMIKFANQLHSAWKKGTTVLWGGFHLRNEQSNVWTLAFKDGVGPKQIRNFRKAIKVFNNPYSDDLIEVYSPTLRKHVKKPIRSVYEQMRKHGIHTGGFYAAELGDELAKPGILGEIAQRGGAVSGAARVGRRAVQAGEKIGSFFENTARIASALNDMEKGVPVKQAAKRVNLAFLNYQDITKVEEKVRKGIPFWTWLSRNFSNQMRYIVEDPGKYSMFTVKPLRAVNWAKEEAKEYMPEWMKEEMYVQPFGAKFRGHPLMYNPNFPFQDVGKLTPRLSEGFGIPRMIGEAVTPFAKTPVEWALNKSYFTDKPIAYHKHDTQKAPTLLEPVLAAFPEPIRRRLGIVKTDRGWELPARWTYALMSYLPQAKIGEPVEHMLRTGVPEYRKTQAPFDIGSRTAGVKFRPLDLQYYRGQAMRERLAELKALNRKYGG